MLSCKDITEVVTTYVEGRMGLLDRVRFRLHIGMCPHCREYVRQMELTRAVVGLAAPPAPPEDVREELERRFAAWLPAARDAPPEEGEDGS
jgi:predicted anti-sigma-YlaC factor YlaD